MKAILVNDDKSLRWDEVPYPVMNDEDVIVKIEAAALNRADLMQREGDYPPPPGCPDWMGLEIAERAEKELPDKDQLILVYCRSGRRSKIASEELVKLGYTNVKEFGGIIDWPYDIVK